MTIGVDFDGVIHAYTRGWADGTIYDPPVTGSLEGLRALMSEHAVFVFTTRDAAQVMLWLTEQGFTCRADTGDTFWNTRGILLVTNRKLAATAYVDDRAIRFQNWIQTLADINDGATPGVMLPSEREIWAAACRAVAHKIRTTNLPDGDGFVDMFDNGTQWAASIADQVATTPPGRA